MAEVRKAQELWQACIPVSALEQEKWDLLSYHLGIQVCGPSLLKPGIGKYVFEALQIMSF